IPTQNSAPHGITAGPDGALWFAESSGSFFGGRIGRISTTGAIREFPLPGVDSDPLSIMAGPDGALWFTEKNANRIRRMTIDGFTTNELPTTREPSGITAGPDGALWFTEAGAIGRIIVPEGVITDEIPVPTPSLVSSITAGPDGALWFTETSANQIGRIAKVRGVYKFKKFPGPKPGRDPFGLGPGPDGGCWGPEHGA